MSAHAPRFVFSATIEQASLVAAGFWVIAANQPFFRALLHGRALESASTWGLLAATGVALVALHLLLLTLVATRRTVKPLLALATVACAFASFYIQQYGVYLDPGMVRNVLHTDVHEAAELLSWALLWHLLLYAAVPLLLLARLRIVSLPWRRALLARTVTVAVTLVALSGALLAAFQPLVSAMRNQRELRYLVTPANVIWSLGSVLTADLHKSAAARVPIGLDARPGASWGARSKPMLVVLVVGETARAANWGLDGYARQTTPELARRDVINFTSVTSCGTSTEVSLPCMFAPVGRRDYDEARIRGSESLLHVLARAGVGVTWIDNQSGCKGVCDGLPASTVQAADAPDLCTARHCLDEALVRALDRRLAQGVAGTQVVVLHMLGNHGPAYFRRYPPAFAKFQPACEADDLHACSREQIVNAYDNALLYTDHVLAALIDRLRGHSSEFDAAMVYVSDHGESLGESGLYLHGIPYAISPEIQTRVPMVMWFSQGFADTARIDQDCLRQRARRAASHDHLFHTLAGLLDVRTAVRDPAWDLVAPCRRPASLSPDDPA
jgi:lipid A ethanolaminephosphotransferase